MALETHSILVDPEDEWLLREHNWSIAQHGYAVRGISINGRWTPTYLHHYIVGQPIWKGEEIDHINRNRLDNRRSNLRYVTHQQNMLNWNQAHGVTGVRGVTPLPHGRYMAQVKRHGQHYYIGSYDTIEEASAAREAWLANYVEASLGRDRMASDV